MASEAGHGRARIGGPARTAIGLAVGLLVIGVLGGMALAGGAETTRVSVSSSGAEANGASSRASISADGRFVAFDSDASNLVPGDTEYTYDEDPYDVFVHDRETSETTRVSVSSSGGEANGTSGHASISADGRFVAFESYASNLASGDTQYDSDVFVHDRETGETTRVSVSSSGAEGKGGAPSISADGRFVAFDSTSSNLGCGDPNVAPCIYVHDRGTGETTRVSLSSSGAEANSWSGAPSISANGRFVAFSSHASNLVSGDANDHSDIFVHDRKSGKTKRVSVRSSGGEGNGVSFDAAISADGRFVAFGSTSSNLVPGDTNAPFGDVFVHDRKSGKTKRVSVSSSGAEGSGSEPSISANGRYVAFESHADLVPGDTNNDGDVFVHDRKSGQTRRVSVSSSGAEGTANSYGASISAGGSFVAFQSYASNLVDGDTNPRLDVLVRGPLR